MPTVEAEDECVFHGKRVRVRLVSPTGCWSDDDMTLTLEQNGKTIEARWPGEFPTRWYELEPGLSDWKVGPACSRIDSLDAGKGRVVMLLSKNGRPNGDHLVGVVYDVGKHKVVSLVDLGATGSLVGRGKRELWFRVAPSSEGATGGPIASPEEQVRLADGDRIVFLGNTYDSLDPVVHVWADSAGVHAAEDWPRTFKFYRRYFASFEEFRVAVRWDTGEYWGTYRTGRTASGRRCLQPIPGFFNSVEVREERLLPWFCEQVSPSDAPPNPTTPDGSKG